RITVNLAPANLRKEGASFDLGIAIGILLASGQIHSGQLVGSLQGDRMLDERFRGEGLHDERSTGERLEEEPLLEERSLSEPLQATMVIGELSLDGALRPVPGVLAMMIDAHKSGIKRVILPAENAREASLIKGIQLFPLKHLAELKEY